MKSTIRESLGSIEMEIPLVTYQRGGIFVCLCPVLRLITYSEDESTLSKCFDEVLDHFFDTQLERGTLKETLIEYGWSYEASKLKRPEKSEVTAGILQLKNISMPRLAAC